MMPFQGASCCCFAGMLEAAPKSQKTTLKEGGLTSVRKFTKTLSLFKISKINKRLEVRKRLGIVSTSIHKQSQKKHANFRKHLRFDIPVQYPKLCPQVVQGVENSNGKQSLLLELCMHVCTQRVYPLWLFI